MLNANEAMDGRELGGMSKSGTSIQYKYDGDGLRTEKTVNGKTTIYSYTGSRLTHLMTEDEGNLYIRYDGNGEAIGLRRGGQEYTYVKNMQGTPVPEPWNSIYFGG